MYFSTHPYLVDALIFFIGFMLARAIYFRPHGRLPVRPPASISDAEIETEIHAGRMIEAIKLYRQRSGCDLKTAKQAIDVIARRNAGSS